MRAKKKQVIMLELDEFEAGWILRQARRTTPAETPLAKSIKGRICTVLEPLEPLPQ